jgi:integrase
MAVYPERRAGKLTGKWIAEVTDHGERRRKRHETQAEAERWCGFIKLTGAPPPEQTVVAEHTFGTVAAEALEHHPGWQADRDPSRGQRLDYVIEVFGKDTPITNIKTTDLDKMVKTLKGRPGKNGKLSAATINRYLAIASAVLTFAHKRAYIAGVPAITWQKEEGKRIHWLSEEVEEAIVAFMLSCGQREAALTVEVLTRTGLRWSEFESLEPGMIGTEWIRLDQTKTDVPRDVPIDPALGARLKYMVVSKLVPPYYTFSKLLKAALKSAGQSEALTVHCLRHTTATRLVLKGVNLAIVQKFMGHRSINTTLKYTHVTPDALAEASKILSPRAGQSAENAPRSNVVSLAEAAAAVRKLEATAGIEPA